jgi:hypothetical protein
MDMASCKQTNVEAYTHPHMLLLLPLLVHARSSCILLHKLAAEVKKYFFHLNKFSIKTRKSLSHAAASALFCKHCWLLLLFMYFARFPCHFYQCNALCGKNMR